MQYKGVLWTVSLLVFSLAAYLASPTQNSLKSTMSAPISASITRSVTKKVFAVETPEGVGAMVRRSIGSGALRNLTPFLMLDHFHAKSGAFPDHPHRGQSTITYMIQGSSSHEDSVGHKGIIETGGVQWMVAGRGIMHSEIPLSGDGRPDPIGLQLWVNLPKQYKMVEPSYQELNASGIPTAYPEGPDGPVKVKVISGKSHGVESPVRPLGGCWYFHYIFSKDQVSVFQDLPAGWTAFIYILKGTLLVGRDSVPQEQFHTLVLSADQNETGILLKSGSADTEFMLAAAEPIDEPIVQYGPFVMNTQEEIMQTLRDYREGRNGFETAHTWKSKNAHE
ncbi:Pirin domain-containing protein [Favolaschia claudopus]|uniref:Pirin domain-containing protein n=1 Tax=Favolaschia claudopus TaxID=2862362 RepID=A0AAW0DGW8_9AGAR